MAVSQSNSVTLITTQQNLKSKKFLTKISLNWKRTLNILRLENQGRRIMGTNSNLVKVWRRMRTPFSMWISSLYRRNAEGHLSQGLVLRSWPKQTKRRWTLKTFFMQINSLWSSLTQASLFSHRILKFHDNLIFRHGDIYHISPIIATLYAVVSKIETFDFKPTGHIKSSSTSDLNTSRQSINQAIDLASLEEDVAKSRIKSVLKLSSKFKVTFMQKAKCLNYVAISKLKNESITFLRR